MTSTEKGQTTTARNGFLTNVTTQARLAHEKVSFWEPAQASPAAQGHYVYVYVYVICHGEMTALSH